MSNTPEKVRMIVKGASLMERAAQAVANELGFKWADGGETYWTPPDHEDEDYSLIFVLASREMKHNAVEAEALDDTPVLDGLDALLPVLTGTFGPSRTDFLFDPGEFEDEEQQKQVWMAAQMIFFSHGYRWVASGRELIPSRGDRGIRANADSDERILTTVTNHRLDNTPSENLVQGFTELIAILDPSLGMHGPWTVGCKDIVVDRRGNVQVGSETVPRDTIAEIHAASQRAYVRSLTD